MVMRPYQIAATEAIIQRIRTSTNQKTWGRREGGGYIWHTTGSGKTLTSFKTARLASRMDEIDKVLFIVDRKDLDYQTMKEYDRFEKGAANSNSSTAVLTRQLNDENCRIIITTIQKLSNFIARNAKHKIYTQHVVMILTNVIARNSAICTVPLSANSPNTTCSASPAPRYFRIMPAQSAMSNTSPPRVLSATDCTATPSSMPFVTAMCCPSRVDYVRTLRPEDEIEHEAVPAIDQDKILKAPERISLITKYILDHFDQKTKRNAQYYDFSKLTNIGAMAKAKATVEEVKVKTKLQGFNSMFAVASIPFVKLYYTELMRQMAELPPNRRLKIATIYSYAANEAEEDFGGDENSENTDGLDQSSRDFLENVSPITTKCSGQATTPPPKNSRTTIKTCPCA